MAEDTKLFSSIAATLFLTGIGYLIITKTPVFADILMNKKKESFLPIENQYAVYVPDIWIPYQPLSSEESIIQQFKPTIVIEDDYYVIRFSSVKTNVDGIISEYTPSPVKIPANVNMDIVDIAAKLVPIVSSTASPIGWSIKFPRFNLQLIR